MSVPYIILKYGLIISGALPALAYLRFSEKGDSERSPLLLAWFTTRVLADTMSFILCENDLNVYPIFHVSICIEFTLMMLYFVKIKKWNQHPLRWILVGIPLVIFLVEILLVNSIFSVNQLSVVSYFMVVALLFLSLIVHPSKLDKKQVMIVWSFFLYHSFFFVYAIFQTELRINSNLMTFIYPFFWTATVVFNLFFAYYFWTFRKLEKGSVPQ
jgi:hypothetical protein